MMLVNFVKNDLYFKLHKALLIRILNNIVGKLRPNLSK